MYPRKLYGEIKPYLNTRDVIVIHGSRQTGKTTLLKRIMQDFPEHDTCYFDLEDSRLLTTSEEGVESILAYLRQTGKLKQQERFFLLIDEIQYLSNPSSLLKLFHDHYPQIKLIVTGSSSFNIKKKFKDTLVGRTINFELYPLDFEEFITFKEMSFNFEEKITAAPLIDELCLLYKEYISFGGYPKIVLTDSQEMKARYLQQIIDTYIKGDIRDLANIRNIDKFNKLLYVLAHQSGQLLNITEVANTAKLSRPTIEEYLFILENTYIIRLLPPFSQNIRSELFKMPKIYFYDTGLLNILRLKMLPQEISGYAFETSIFSEFIKNYKTNSLFFWRTQDKKEIDFILHTPQTLIPFEVKLNSSSFHYTAVKYFHSKYATDHHFCISLMGELPHNKFDIINMKPWEMNFYCRKLNIS